MFDIFMADADGSPQHLESVRCLSQAQEMAFQLSTLIPGKHFGYFERSEDEAELLWTMGSRAVDMPNNSDLWRRRDERVAN
jgi:hypothetical protein